MTCLEGSPLTFNLPPAICPQGWGTSGADGGVRAVKAQREAPYTCAACFLSWVMSLLWTSS